MSVVLQGVLRNFNEPMVKTATDLENSLLRLQNQAGFYNYLVRSHLSLEIEYSTVCAQLVHAAHLETIGNEQEAVLTEQLKTALIMAKILTELYRNYLCVAGEALRLQQEQDIFRSLLTPEDTDMDSLVPKPSSWTKIIRGRTAELNWFRLFSVRTRRLLTLIVPLITPIAKNVAQAINTLDKFAGPALAYFAWIFYIPRLSVNLILLFKHLGFRLEGAQKELYLYTRLIGQLQRRWFELGNDIAWLIAGVLCCFVLIGPLAPAGTYLTVGLFFFDVVMATLRAVFELGRIKKLQEEYNAIVELCRGNGDFAMLREIGEYQTRLAEQYQWEQKRLLLAVVITSLLFIAMCTAIPALVIFNPIVVLLGAALILSFTLTAYLGNKYLEMTKPGTKIDNDFKRSLAALPRNGFFGAQAPEVPEPNKPLNAEGKKSPK